ncbi:MAG: FecR domain-containing protein, partial [Rhodospirillaceae bacterium]
PETAAEWMVRLNGPALSEAERKALSLWLSEDSARLKELEELRLVWQIAGRAVVLPDVAARLTAGLEQATRPSQRWKSGRGAIAGALAVAASICAVVVVQRAERSDALALANGSNVQTAVGQIQHYTLPDTSSVTVAADSAVSVNFTEGQREIALGRGEVYLEVAHDRARPFTVMAGSHSVTVTGTQFNLNFDAARNVLEVAVTEGSVDVGLGSGVEAKKVEKLKAGDVVLFEASGDTVRRRVTPKQAADWRQGAMHFDQTRLRDAIVEMNRYAAKPIVATDEKITTLTLTGRFEARDTASFIYALETVFGLKTVETPRAWEISFQN